MQLRPLLLWGLLLLCSGTAFADATDLLRAMDRFREEKVRTEKDLAEVRRELAVTIEEQRDNPKPARAAEVEKTRHEVEVTVSVL